MKKLHKSLLAGMSVIAAACIFGTLRERPSQPSTQERAGDIPKLSPKLSRIRNTELALAERLEAAREIPTDLSDEEVRELIDFLSEPLEDHNRENELLAINQVMDQLRVSGLASGEYAIALCRLIQDSAIHPVVRDYAIQHASQWMRDDWAGQPQSEVSEKDRKRMLDCIVFFLQEPDSLHETGYGTALNALSTLEASYPEEIREIFTVCGPKLFDVASGRESAPLSNRIAAIQALPSLPNREEALGQVRDMTKNRSGGSPVRLVAIATLGKLGDQSDIVILRQIQNDNSRFAYAARSAVTRIQSNTNSVSQ